MFALTPDCYTPLLCCAMRAVNLFGRQVLIRCTTDHTAQQLFTHCCACTHSQRAQTQTCCHLWLLRFRYVTTSAVVFNVVKYFWSIFSSLAWSRLALFVCFFFVTLPSSLNCRSAHWHPSVENPHDIFA